MKKVPMSVKLSTILFISIMCSNTAFAVATVETRGEPLMEMDTYSSPSTYNARPASSVPSAAQASSADRVLQTLNQIESLKQEVSELRGLVEVQDHEIKQLKKSQQDLYLDLEKRIAQIPAAKGNRSAETIAATALQTANKAKGIQIIPKGKENTKATPSNPKVSGHAEIAEPSISAPTPSAPIATPSQISKTPAIPRKDKDYTASDATDTVSVKPTTSSTTGKSSSQVVKINPGSTTSTTPGSQPGTFKMHQSNSEKEAFDAAYNMVASKQYDTAISALQDFLVQYPRGEFAPNANYWLGEVHMVKWQSDKSNTGTLDEASRYFNNVSKDFPGTAKVSDSLLKLGIIAAEKGDNGNARRYFTDVKMQYPDSAAARVADAKLQQIE